MLRATTSLRASESQARPRAAHAITGTRVNCTAFDRGKPVRRVLARDGAEDALASFARDPPSTAGGRALAEAEGLALTPTHWAVLNALREFYAEFQLSPATRPLVKYIALKLGPETGNSACLNQLFKGTPAKLAAKLAGLPKPTNCI